MAEKIRLEDRECPLSATLGLVGEWWTLLILHDAFDGYTRFDQFQANLGISSSLLTSRLKRLVAEGLLARVTADTPAAAQALAAGHAELRQSLGTLGLNLTRLHIGHSGQAPLQGDGATAQGHSGGDRPGARAGLFGDTRAASRTSAIGAVEGEDTPDSAVAQVEPTPTPSSSRALVDVLV